MSEMIYATLRIGLTDVEGYVTFKTLKLEDAERLAKEIANTIHEMRTGKRADEVGFVFWNTTTLPERADEYLVTREGFGGPHVGFDDFAVDITDPEPRKPFFQCADPDELYAWAEYPAPVVGKTFAEREKEKESEEWRPIEPLRDACARRRRCERGRRAYAGSRVLLHRRQPRRREGRAEDPPVLL